MAPRGILEFVPPDDPMAKRLLGQRSPDSLDYSEAAFVHHLSQQSTIRGTSSLPGGGRRLYAFERRGTGALDIPSVP